MCNWTFFMFSTGKFIFYWLYESLILFDSRNALRNSAFLLLPYYDSTKTQVDIKEEILLKNQNLFAWPHDNLYNDSWNVLFCFLVITFQNILCLLLFVLFSVFFIFFSLAVGCPYKLHVSFGCTALDAFLLHLFSY